MVETALAGMKPAAASAAILKRSEPAIACTPGGTVRLISAKRVYCQRRRCIAPMSYCERNSGATCRHPFLSNLHRLMNFELLESIGLGLGLGIAAGFRVVVPFLVVSAAALFGHLPLQDQMAWLGTYPAFIGLSVALVVEVLAYSIPWVDSFADTVALPVAAIAGTAIMALATNQLDPFAQWSLAIVVGGGAATTVRGLNGFTRLLSTTTTGGLANFLIAIGEMVGALTLSVLSLVAPIVTLGLVLILLIALVRFAVQTFDRSPAATPEAD